MNNKPITPFSYTPPQFLMNELRAAAKKCGHTSVESFLDYAVVNVLGRVEALPFADQQYVYVADETWSKDGYVKPGLIGQIRDCTMLSLPDEVLVYLGTSDRNGDEETYLVRTKHLRALTVGTTVTLPNLGYNGTIGWIVPQRGDLCIGVAWDDDPDEMKDEDDFEGSRFEWENPFSLLVVLER